MKKFTLIEILFVVTILIILISIGLAAGSKVLRKQASIQRSAEIVLIEASIRLYEERYGVLPFTNSGVINFAWQLSSMRPIDNNGDGVIDKNDMIGDKRPRWIPDDSIMQDFNFLYDPYEEKYQIYIDGAKWSVQ